MTPAEFHVSLAAAAPPAGLAAPLAALWWTRRGDWERAHALVQDDPSAAAAWVHAHLHRVEGDAGNAAYWYRRASRPLAQEALAAEWSALVDELLRGRTTD